MTLFRRNDAATVTGPPREYRGCRCSKCMPSTAPPEPPPQRVTITQAAVDRVITSAFGRMPDPAE